MKLNIKKAVLFLTCFIAMFSVTVGFMCPSANAAITCYNPKNWIEDVVYSGNTKTVKYHISGNESYFDIAFYKTTTSLITGSGIAVTGASYSFPPHSDAVKTRARIYLLGGYNPIGSQLSPYSSVYVGDFKAGAEVDIKLQYKATVKLQDITDNACFLTWNTYLYCYNQDGGFVTMLTFESANVNVLESSGTINIDTNYAYERDSKVYYVCPVIEINFNHAKNTSGLFSINLMPWDFRFSVATNMIDENSQTMQDIKDTLGDISDQIGETNEKLDDIISGGDAGSSLNGTTGGVRDDNEVLGDTLDDYQDAQEALPTTPENFDDIPHYYKIDFKSIGLVGYPRALILIDESSIEADSRNWERTNGNFIKYLLLHRHWENDMFFFTQIWNRVDKTIRDITEECVLLHKGKIFRGFTRETIIRYGIMIPQVGQDRPGEIIMGYLQPTKVSQIFERRFWRRPYYKYFDTLDRPNIPLFKCPEYGTDL